MCVWLLSFWLGGFVLYGYGWLIDNTDKIEKGVNTKTVVLAEA